MKNIRLIPKVYFINYRKEFPNMVDNCFNEWFTIQRFWYGRIININIKHYCLKFDFRKNWLLDMVKING
jgi:hypothetical protein